MSPIPDTSSDECRRILRKMELETYGAVVSTLRAQGELNRDRRKLLQDLSTLFQISPERHKAEVRRAVNDEKLAIIANRITGGADTEWEWALEGRRIVPLMPRLLHPTPFTSLATAVNKAVSQNPKIYLDQIKVQDKDEVNSKYVRDPDDEDTLSPVMIPVASPDSSCHSNNNIEADVDAMDEKITPSSTNLETSKNSEAMAKSISGSCTTIASLKRPRSPAIQASAVMSPSPKVRAISPSCIKQQRVMSTQVQPVTKGVLLTQAKPVVQLQNPGVSGKIRIKSPAAQTNLSLRPTLRPTIPQNSQTPHQSPRPLLNSSIKQVVQIRGTPLHQPLPNNGKESNFIRPGSQTAASVASSIAKSLPGKANVIVLHKNSPASKNIVVSKDFSEKHMVTKGNLLTKPVTTSMGTKMTFPGVRIITVPSGGSSQTSTSSGSALSTGKSAVPKTQPSNISCQNQNVFLLELTKEELSRSIVLSDLVPTSVANSNGIITLVENEVKGHYYSPSVKSDEPENGNEILGLEDILDNGRKGGANESAAILQSYSFNLSSEEGTVRNDSCDEHVIVQSIPHVEEQIISPDENIQVEQSAVHGILDPHTGSFYSKSVEMTEDLNCQTMDRSTVNIFSSALAPTETSLDIDCLSDESGGTRLISTDACDNQLPKSSL